MRLQAVDFRKRADHLRWNRIVTEQEQNIGDAMRAVSHGADLAHLESAVATAQRSEIGQGHEIVLEGKRQIVEWRKHRRLEDIAMAEEEYQRRLLKAVEIADLGI